MTNLVNYQPFHYQEIALRPINGGENMPPADVIRSAKTFFYGGQAVAVVGGVVALDGVLSVYGLITDRVRSCPKSFLRAMRILLEEQLQYFRRIVLTVRVDFLAGHRFARALGFESEGIMRAYGSDGSDYIMFGRVA